MRLCPLNSVRKGREGQPLLPGELPQKLCPCPFWKEGQAFTFPAHGMSASDCTDVPKSNLACSYCPGRAQRTGALVFEGGQKLKNWDMLSEERITWYLWLKCWSLPTRKALRRYRLFNQVRQTLLLFGHNQAPAFVFSCELQRDPPGCFRLGRALKAAMFTYTRGHPGLGPVPEAGYGLHGKLPRLGGGLL